MSTAPYGVRLLVGVAVTALDETRKLPQTILAYPMTVASQVAHLVMKVQQDVADLVIRGDETLESLFPPKDEQPEWATFDEDLPADETDGVDIPVNRTNEGRFALYSEGEPDRPAEDKPAPRTNGSAPAVVADLGYDALTLAQLRARMTSLKVDELEALLAYEEATKARAPFQTLLANRITRATAK
ncbi:lipid droplet-associated protein [Mycolicibacterium cosmeticum]|uniref:lipid droplet-associated protein n=1 Tax=Mycolicibacterium cosmeticum TaxID=258533 RepID=UPI0032047F14